MLFTLQRYEFLSKSQREPQFLCLNFDVIYLTKVRIFKQITTLSAALTALMKMLFTLQRYEFLSKSQHSLTTINKWLRCYLPYKGTNF